MVRFFVHLLLFSAASLLRAEDPQTRQQVGFLESYRATYRDAHESANAKRDEELRSLDTFYRNALERQIGRLRTTGKLDTVIPFLDELRNLSDDAAELPALPDSAPAELRKMRDTHATARHKILQEHANTVTSLADKMIATLQAHETELTKGGQLDVAIATRELRESFEKDATIGDARDLLDGGSGRPAATRGGWSPLSGAKMQVISGAGRVLAWMDEAGKKLAPPQAFIPLKRKRIGQDSLLLVAPALLEFTLPQAVTEFRGEVILTMPGDVGISIIAGNKVVQSFELPKSGDSRKLNLSFPATKKLRLEVRDNGDHTHDWVMFLSPEVR